MKAIQRIVCRLGRLQRVLAIAFVLPCVGWPRAVGETDSVPLPVWELDLSKFEYQPKPTDKDNEGAGRFWQFRQNLVFTQENVLATTFQVHIENSGPSVRDKSQPSDPYHMVAVFLDSERGATLHKIDWPVNPSIPTSFFAGQKGQFVVGIGAKFSVYSADLSLMAEKSLPSAYPPLGTTESPSGDAFLVYYIGGPEVGYKNTLDLLGVTDLSVIGSWTGDLARPPWSLWGTELVRRAEHNLQFLAPGAEPKNIAQSKEQYCGQLSFINRETLAVGKLVRGGCNEIVALISRDGTVLDEMHFAPTGYVEPVVASRNGKVFAVASYTSQKAPARPTVRVYRLGSETPILTLDVVAPEARASLSMGERFDFLAWWWSAEWGAMALSPEGDLLAVRAGPIVHLYRVPPASR
jgi:hypothetical protein